MMTRRQLISHAGTIAGGTFTFSCRQNAQAATGSILVGCRRIDDDDHRLTGVDQYGRMLFDLPLPGRGHDIAFHPEKSEAVVFARRPGTFAQCFDVNAGRYLQRLQSRRNRHFYGHGTFTKGGDILLTTENDYETGEGRIGIRDTVDRYHLVSEIASYGIGPHDITLLPDGKTLAVANGGIRTHPSRPREKLNIEDMRPNLALIELASGRLIHKIELPKSLHKLSIRHLDVSHDGGIAVAMQYEGGKSDDVPLIAVLDGEHLRTFTRSAKFARSWRHYTASISFDHLGKMIAVSAPRGDCVSFWDAESGEMLTSARAIDAGGVAPLHSGFISSGQELLRWQNGQSLPMSLNRPNRWDNHLAIG